MVLIMKPHIEALHKKLSAYSYRENAVELAKSYEKELCAAYDSIDTLFIQNLFLKQVNEAIEYLRKEWLPND